MSRVALKVLVVAALLLAMSLGVSAQVKPTDEQMKELQAAMDEVQRASAAAVGADRGDPAVNEEFKAREKLIKLTDKYYKISAWNLWTEPFFDSQLDGDGSAQRMRGKYVKVRIGIKAFFSVDGKTPSIPWLASTKLHEIGGHGAQAADQKGWGEDDKGHGLNEIEAYDLELRYAETFGLSEDEIAELKRRRQGYYDQLNDANKAKIDGGDYKVAFAAPTGNSQNGLAGKAALFVSREVYADELATATVRGPRTLEGNVITTEVDGKKGQARTDKRGGTMLNLPDSLSKITSPTVATVRVLDSTGKEIARTQTRVLPGPAPDVVSKPVINNIPANIRRGDVITIPGRSLGPECEVIVGNQIQETLSASVNEVTSYVDTPQLGTQDAWVRNPYGESKSFECNVYSFEVSAPRTTISRGEELTATANYQSLRPGSEIRFKNNTPGVVTMNVPGARTTGNEAVLVVQNPNGTIPVNLKGVNSGAFSIAYEVVPPPQR